MNKVKLEKISKSISSGITPLRSNLEYWDDGNIPWLKTEQLGEKYIYDTIEKITQYALENTTIKLNPINTLSIAMYGEGRTRGNISILKSKMTTNQACCNVVIDEDKADYEYIYYYLKTQYHQLRNLSSGVRKNLNSNDIKNFEVRLPKDIITQKKIASVLSAFDDKIEINNRINSELENLAKTIYDYWFVQFDFPDENGKPYKSSGGKMVYNQELKREIPAGWEVGTLQEWIDFKRGISYKSTEIQDTGIPLLNLNSFTLSGKFKPDGTKYFNGSFKEDSRLNYGDLVIAITDVTRNAIIIGKSFIVPDLFDQPPLISCDVASVISKSNFNNYYLEMLFNSEIYHEYIKHFASGTLVLHLDLNGMLWFKTFMPQKRLLDKFAEIKKSIIEKQTINVIENQQLTQLRDWLLPMLMNGQITVK
jgi:type I restriction enzyme, S subunit